MPLLDGPVIGQVLLVFLMIGLLGFVLRWAFSRDKDAPEWPTPEPGGTPAASRPEPARPTTGLAAADAVEVKAPTVAADDDFGLLKVVTIVPTAEEAKRMRRLLADAGIRATTTIGTDGQHRVLVFANDVLRARRLTA